MRNLVYRPVCARCGKPVDSAVETEHYGYLRITVTCHGERESVDIAPNAKGIVFGRAFVSPARLAP